MSSAALRQSYPWFPDALWWENRFASIQLLCGGIVNTAPWCREQLAAQLPEADSKSVLYIFFRLMVNYMEFPIFFSLI